VPEKTAGSTNSRERVWTLERSDGAPQG